MSGETEDKPSPWTVDSLMVHMNAEFRRIKELMDERDLRYQQRFDAQREQVKDALIAAKEAVSKQEDENKAWRAQANEWRGQSADRERTQQEQIRELVATFIPRKEAEASIKSMGEKVDLLKSFADSAGGGAKQRQQNLALALAAVAVISLLLAVVQAITR